MHCCFFFCIVVVLLLWFVCGVPGVTWGRGRWRGKRGGKGEGTRVL